MSLGLDLSLARPRSRTATPTNSAQVQQFFDRLIALPAAPRQTLYANLISALVSGGVWSKLDALYIFAAADAGTSLTNLVQGPFLATLDVVAGSPTFTADRGWSNGGAVTQKDVNTNFNPSTAGGNYTQNNAMICNWNLIATPIVAVPLWQNATGDSHVELWPLYTDTHTYWAINGTGTEITSTLGLDASGFWLVQRTASNACELNRNDTQVATSANASAALTNSNLVSQLYGTTGQSFCMAMGASLTTGQKTALLNALQAYKTGVGA